MTGMLTRNSIPWLMAALLIGATASAHHSDAALDMSAQVAFEGTVSEYSMRNPHSYFTVDVTGDDGTAVTWTVQMASAISIRRSGWTPDSLAVGDEVAVEVHPARDGRSYGLLVAIEKDGVPISNVRVSGRSTASTTTIEGRWFIDRESLGDDYPGGLDQLMARDLTLTEAGRAAQAVFDQNADDNPELACLSKPTPGGLVYTDFYPMEIEFLDGGEIIAIRSQYMDQERTVYMDGRPHPADERTYEGHSIGWWEDDVLVVDTANFADNRSPYQNGIPSGAQKHVVERYRLHSDGTRLRVEFTLEDPEYIVGSMTHVRDLVYSPDIDMTPFNCDLEATRRFVPR